MSTLAIHPPVQLSAVATLAPRCSKASPTATASGQLAVRVLPHKLWERLLLSGISAEVWMEPGVSTDNLASNTAQAYSTPEASREGKIALVLGAGNVSSIAPLDVLHKLLAEHQVCILKLNPVNEYMLPYFSAMLQPAIDLGIVRIVKGGAELGAYLGTHPLVQAIHITGSEAVHDAIVWGVGDDAREIMRLVLAHPPPDEEDDGSSGGGGDDDDEDDDDDDDDDDAEDSEGDDDDEDDDNDDEDGGGGGGADEEEVLGED